MKQVSDNIETGWYHNEEYMMNTKMKKKYIIFAILALIAVACQPDKPEPQTQTQTQTEWIARTVDFQQNYTLDQMVILSRHNIRSPLVSKNSVLTRLTNNDYQWFLWEGQPSTLTAKGERLETRMGTFFKERLEKKESSS